jgi:hypothetical protein
MPALGSMAGARRQACASAPAGASQATARRACRCAVAVHPRRMPLQCAASAAPSARARAPRRKSASKTHRALACSSHTATRGLRGATAPAAQGAPLARRGVSTARRAAAARLSRAGVCDGGQGAAAASCASCSPSGFRSKRARWLQVVATRAAGERASRACVWVCLTQHSAGAAPAPARSLCPALVPSSQHPSPRAPAALSHNTRTAHQ